MMWTSSSYYCLIVLSCLCVRSSFSFVIHKGSEWDLSFSTKAGSRLAATFGNKVPGKNNLNKKKKTANSNTGNSVQRRKSDDRVQKNSKRPVRNAPVPDSTEFNAIKSSDELASELKSKEYFFSKKELKSSEFLLEKSDGIFMKLCSSANIDRPSRIQALAWPALLSGKHAVVADQTGSGKTLAYLLPLLQRMKMNEEKCQTVGSSKDGAASIKLLILAPTAELCDQVRDVCAKLAGKSGIPFRTMVATANGQKSAPIREQIRELQNTNVDVLVSTPGRVAAFLKAGAIDLSYLEAVVLDEVDILMVDETFGPQLRTVGVAAPSKTQFVFVTATLPDTVVNNVKSEFPGVVVVKGPGLHKVAPNLQEHLVDVSVPPEMNRDKKACFNLKSSELLRSLRKNKSERTLVFCNTVDSCRDVENFLRRNDRREKSYKVGCYHGALSPSKRNQDLASFSRREHNVDQILICTDRAARGVDFGGSIVDHVVIFDFPKDPAEYIRRVGRTARAGRSGISTVFAYGWQLPIARNIMGSKLESFSIASSNKIRGNDESVDSMIGSNIQEGRLWKESPGKNSYFFDDDER